MLKFSIATPDRTCGCVRIVSRPIILSVWSLSVYFTGGSVTDWSRKARLLKSSWNALILISSSTRGSSKTRDLSSHNEGLLGYEREQHHSRARFLIETANSYCARDTTETADRPSRLKCQPSILQYDIFGLKTNR